MPCYALPPSQPLQTSLRTLRRTIGHPIHPTPVESLPSAVTHIILTKPAPSLAFFAALVDPGLHLVHPDQSPYALPCTTLAPGELSWAGFAKLSARAFWQDTGQALTGIKLSTQGALRPRRAGYAAPSTDIIRVLIQRAGGVLSDGDPDIVLVAPGASRNSARVKKFLQEGVLCLGAGFVVDLLLRIRADPKEYVVFPEQRDLCGPVLHEAVIRAGRPLPVSKRVLEGLCVDSVGVEKGRVKRGRSEGEGEKSPASTVTPEGDRLRKITLKQTGKLETVRYQYSSPPDRPAMHLSEASDIISPTTPTQNPPKRPRLNDSPTCELSSVRSSRRRSRLDAALSDTDTIGPRQLHFPRLDDPNGDASVATMPFSHAPRSPTASVMSGRKDEQSFSVEKGFRFLFACLGKPSQADVDRLLKCIKDGGDMEENYEDEERHNKNAMKGGTQGITHGLNPRAAESPLLDEEDGPFHGIDDFPRSEKIENEALDGMDEVVPMPSQRRLSRGQGVQREPVDAFRIPVPRQVTILSNIIRPEMAALECADQIHIEEGHARDDQACQGSVDCIDWTLGAENLIGVSRDAICPSLQGTAVGTYRRLWNYLFESRALQRFAAPSGLSDPDARTLTGICIRLISSGLASEMKISLIQQLLKVRDEQVRGGFDSLQTVLSSHDQSNVPFQHKALAAIWTTVLQSSVSAGDHAGAWEVLNGAMIPRVDDILDPVGLKEVNRQRYLEKELKNIFQISVLISFMFSTKLDVNIAEETEQRDKEETSLRPSNWPLFYHCVEKLCEMASSLDDRNIVPIISTSLLRLVSVTIGGKIWPVTDKVIVSASKMIGILSSLAGKSCFCVTPLMIASQFPSLTDDNASARKSIGTLKTPCDFLLLLGWLYTTYGQGNLMKRAMTVIRSGTPFTRSKARYPYSSSQSINHHVGLLLTVADSLSHSTKDGEYLLCKMLTSKCPRAESTVERLASAAGDHEQDVCWRSTLEAVSCRCEVLLARQESVHVYANWLSQNLVETLCLLLKSSERRLVNPSEKEALRVQDSVLCNLAMRMISFQAKVNQSVLTLSWRESDDAQRLVRGAIEKPAAHLPSYMKFSGDIISQIRSNPEESKSKNRHKLVCCLLSLVESQILLVRHLLASKRRTELASSPEGTSVPRLSDDVLCFITDNTTEQVIMNVVGTGQLLGEELAVYDTMKTAAGILANLIELRFVQNGQTIPLSANNDIVLLQRANMDVAFRFEEGPLRSMPMKAAPPEVEDRCRLAFWSHMVQSTWMHTFLQQRGRPHVICVSAVLSLLTSLTDSWSTGDRTTVFRMCLDCTRLEPLRYIFEPLKSSINRLDNSNHPLARVEVVEKALRTVVKHWPAMHVRSLLKHLDSRLKPLTSSKSGVPPDTIILYGFTHALSAQLIGFSQARFLHTPLNEVAQAVGRMANSPRDRSKTFHLVQSRVLSALCMTTSDMETRVLVLRVANAFPAADALPGLWGAPLLPTEEVSEDWTRRAAKHAQEWRSFVFTGVVEDPLFAGRNVGYAVRRLAAALRGDPRMKPLVQGVLSRGKGRLDLVLQRDGRAWREWTALQDELLHA